MTTPGRSVGIVGGGLAGLAAAAALVERGFRVELFEAKRQLGGRAGSFVVSATGELVDHCQHVAMGCCTEFLHFIRRTGVAHLFRRDEVLHFFSPDGKQFDVRASQWLPAPLHLAPSMAKLGYLSWQDKLGIARAMLALVRYHKTETASSATIGQWLRDRRQSTRAIERFWQVVLVSALGEELDRASLAAARKVFVDGFMASRSGYQLWVPQAPLGEIYEQGIATWLRERGVLIHLGTPVTMGRASGSIRVAGLVLPDGTQRPFDHVIVATNWKSLTDVLPRATFPELSSTVASASELVGSPITSLHLWFDRAITPLPHAVLVGRLSQWVFAHGDHCYQVVISASRLLAGRNRDDVLREVLGDLAAIFPEARNADAIRWRMLTQQDAVFSYRPGLDAVRPAQRTSIENLFLAGDYTATGWPATMESAVRSGNLAADAIEQSVRGGR